MEALLEVRSITIRAGPREKSPRYQPLPAETDRESFASAAPAAACATPGVREVRERIVIAYSYERGAQVGAARPERYLEVVGDGPASCGRGLSLSLRGGDPVRIVPLYPAAGLSTTAPGAVATATPRLVYNGGPLLVAAEVVVVFWGVWWEETEGVGLAGQVTGFFDFVLASELIDQLGEYSVPGQTIAHGQRAGAVTITAPAPAASLSDTSIEQMLQREIAAGTLPASNRNMLYFLFLPPGVEVVQGATRSCQGFCGYHDQIGGEVFYAVMPYPGCAGCVGGLSVIDALTSTSSHELCEAITDPIPGQGWYDAANGEIGDICAWRTRPLGSYVVQLEWSSRQGACI